MKIVWDGIMKAGWSNIYCNREGSREKRFIFPPYPIWEMSFLREETMMIMNFSIVKTMIIFLVMVRVLKISHTILCCKCQTNQQFYRIYDIHQIPVH